MNTNPKTLVAVKWADLKASSDLTDFILDQMQDGDQNEQGYITRQWLADTLKAIKDLSAQEEDFDPSLVQELAAVAKVVTAKGIQVILV
jgi:hypothetical protein